MQRRIREKLSREDTSPRSLSMLRNIKRNAPGWLGLSPDRRSFIYLPERAQVVQEIFQLNISGFGGRAIAQLLNAKKVPGFGYAEMWDQSTIHNILTNRATFGEYQKKRKARGGVQKIGDPIPDYYPAVITYSTFEAAESARRHNMEFRSGRRGKEIANLFFGVHMACFYCDSSIKFFSNSNENCLICSAVISGEECPRFAWTYQDFEETLVNSLFAANHYPDLTESLKDLLIANSSGGEGDRLEARMKIAGLLKTFFNRVRIASAGGEPPPPKRHLLIRRNHPTRFFEVEFRQGFSVTVLPKKTEPAGAKIDSILLEQNFLLSPRQSQITSLLAQGYTLKQSAEQLSQTLETARWHLREIFRRTNTHSQAELIELVRHVCSV